MPLLVGKLRKLVVHEPEAHVHEYDGGGEGEHGETREELEGVLRQERGEGERLGGLKGVGELRLVQLLRRFSVIAAVEGEAGEEVQPVGLAGLQVLRLRQAQLLLEGHHPRKSVRRRRLQRLHLGEVRLQAVELLILVIGFRAPENIGDLPLEHAVRLHLVADGVNLLDEQRRVSPAHLKYLQLHRPLLGEGCGGDALVRLGDGYPADAEVKGEVALLEILRRLYGDFYRPGPAGGDVADKHGVQSHVLGEVARDVDRHVLHAVVERVGDVQLEGAVLAAHKLIG